jgi:hypothetical protein
MKGSGLTAAPRLAVALTAAAGCLALGACSGNSTGAQPPPTTPTISATAQKFCNQVLASFHSLDGHAVVPTMSLRAAHSDVNALVDAAIASFEQLAADAPASVKSAVREIVTDFKTFKKKSDKTKTVHKLMASTASSSPVQTVPYHDLLAYSAKHC